MQQKHVDVSVEKLITKIIAGDAQAEHQLINGMCIYERVQQMVFGRMTNVAAYDKQDIVHEVVADLLIALRAGRFQPERAPFGAFLWGITRNKISLYYKKHARYGWMSSVEDQSALEQPLTIESEQQTSLLQELLDLLDEKYREVIELRFFEEMDIEDIAENLGLRQKQVRNRLTYAFQLLRQYAYGEYSLQLQA